jgi:hypothetical protein
VFDQHRLIAISYCGITKKTAKQKIIQLPTCTYDLLSVLYFTGNIDVYKYKQGNMIPARIFVSRNHLSIKVRYEEKFMDFEIKNLGTFNTIKVIPDLVTGNVLKDGNRMHVWLTNDGNKLPLMIEPPLSLGSSKAVLKSYSGLKFKFDLGDK